MTRKHGTAVKPVAVSGGEILAALREGRLTRGQFDAWHASRRRSVPGIVITMREKPRKTSARRHGAR